MITDILAGEMGIAGREIILHGERADHADMGRKIARDRPSDIIRVVGLAIEKAPEKQQEKERRRGQEQRNLEETKVTEYYLRGKFLLFVQPVQTETDDCRHQQHDDHICMVKRFRFFPKQASESVGCPYHGNDAEQKTCGKIEQYRSQRNGRSAVCAPAEIPQIREHRPDDYISETGCQNKINQPQHNRILPKI